MIFLARTSQETVRIIGGSDALSFDVFVDRWNVICAASRAAGNSASRITRAENSATTNSAPAPAPDPNVVTIPAGTRIPLSLKQAISTKNAREGDAVYAETVFPYVVDNHVIVPAGSYVQGKIAHVERAGHGKGRAEILMHFTSIILSQWIHRNAARIGPEYSGGR